MKIRNVFIYALIDPETNEIRYIGKAVNPKNRLLGHLREAKKNIKHNHKVHWIRKLLSKNLKPIVLTLEEVSEDIWREKEREYITFYKKQGFRLTNGTNGGEGISFWKLLEISKKRKGSHHSEETKNKIAATVKAGSKEKWTPELRAKLCASQQIASKNRKPAGAILWKQNGLVHWQFRPIIKYNLEGKQIQTFNSPDEITNYCGRKGRRNIQEYCRGTYIPTDSFVYRYLEPKENELPNTKESILETIDKIKSPDKYRKKYQRTNNIQAELAKERKKAAETEFLKNNKVCFYCSTPITYKQRNQKFCCHDCSQKYRIKV